MSRKIQHIIVVGCGLHFRERYYSVLQQQADMRISMVIDLEAEEERIRHFFSDKSLTPEQYLFLPDQYRNDLTPEELDKLLCGRIYKKAIDAVIICTEPKAHKAYAIWAVRNNLHVFTDKPLTAFSSRQSSESLLQDFYDISGEIRNEQLNFVVSCERRAHTGYNYVRQFLSDLIRTYRVPITFIDIHFGGGMWNMPDELFYRENHPYKYGYGVMLHSGYHYIDLLFSLMSLNKILYPDMHASTLHALAISPADHLGMIDQAVYERCLHTDRFSEYFQPDNISRLHDFGETDVTLSGDFKSNGKRISHYCLQLMETSASNRGWHQLPENTYISNGRLRQESVIIHVGPLCSIHISSHSLSKQQSADKTEHFTIEIINNTNVTGHAGYIQLNRKDITDMYPEMPLNKGMNVAARQWQLQNFLQGGDAHSSLSSHREGIAFIDKVYRQLQTNMEYANAPNERIHV
ncbi:Gfo/Idh/MocA family oxidoreductase [Chitinophaga ginsengisoli]|nr:Gfo/Idh/MocA family oxidoreductase [Chitinophaga ginsengisoli]